MFVHVKNEIYQMILREIVSPMGLGDVPQQLTILKLDGILGGYIH